MAVAGSCSYNLTPSLETSICHRGGPKKQKKKGVYLVFILVSDPELLKPLGFPKCEKDKGVFCE